MPDLQGLLSAEKKIARDVQTLHLEALELAEDGLESA
jgi:hypothetical protein